MRRSSVSHAAISANVAKWMESDKANLNDFDYTLSPLNNWPPYRLMTSSAGTIKANPTKA